MKIETKVLNAAWQAVNETLKKNRMLNPSVMLYGGQFFNPCQQRVANRFLLNNDEFIKAAEALASRTKEKVAIYPLSKANPGVSLAIFKFPQNPFDSHFVKGISEGIDDRFCNASNQDAVKRFIGMVKKYINNEI